VRNNKKVVVLGGGSAGWITALYVRKLFPNIKITLIESKDIGILGAGEGTTPDMINFLDFIGIPTSEVIKNCKATIKNGIKFSDWSYSKNSFFNQFGIYRPWGLDSIDSSSDFIYGDTHLSFLEAHNRKHKLEKFSLTQKLSDKNLTLFYKNGFSNNNYSNIMQKYNSFGSYSIHFDARLFAEYLKKIGVSRNINVIEDTVKNVEFGEDGYVKSLELENIRVQGDFFFDCSGFKRFLINRFKSSSWESYKKYLPLDTALPFFIQHDDKNVPPYTEAIAMNYGWMWKIPVQGRYGCGYVFDSNHISEDKAKEEIEEKLGKTIEISKVFKFEAGFYKNVLNKNVMAVGLSAGFVEPLEATSIGLTIRQLVFFLSDKNNLISNDPLYEKIFNNNFQSKTKEILDFLILHYQTNRSDTDFWKQFLNKSFVTDSVKEKQEKWNISIPSKKEFDSNCFFGPHNYLSILYGLKTYNKELFDRVYLNNEFPIGLKNAYDQMLVSQNDALSIAVTHDNFLKNMKNY